MVAVADMAVAAVTVVVTAEAEEEAMGILPVASPLGGKSTAFSRLYCTQTFDVVHL